MSAATGPNPFAKSSGFTQPLNQTRAVVEYEGNVNFEKEKTTVAFSRTQGRDLGVRNPYMEKYTQISNFEEIRSKVIDLCKQRSANGLRGIRRMFKAMDRNGNNSLSPVEFKYAMRDYGLNLSEIEVTQIVKYFDTNKDGQISFDEFLRAIRGDLNERRTDMVHQAYRVLDKDGSGQVTIDDIRIAYDVSFHPDFQSGHKTADEILSDFMSLWETHKRDHIVTIEEFEDYYKDISASIDSDDYFELMIRNA
jgi:Ca2+-binding EF-hand superfamily protein